MLHWQLPSLSLANLLSRYAGPAIRPKLASVPTPPDSPNSTSLSPAKPTHLPMEPPLAAKLRQSCSSTTSHQGPRKRVFGREFWQNARLSWLCRSQCQMYSQHNSQLLMRDAPPTTPAHLPVTCKLFFSWALLTSYQTFYLSSPSYSLSLAFNYQVYCRWMESTLICFLAFFLKGPDVWGRASEGMLQTGEGRCIATTPP